MTDANADTGSVPFSGGDTELAIRGAVATIEVTVGELKGTIQVTVRDTDAERNATATGTFDTEGERRHPGSALVSLDGELEDGTLYSAYCWVPQQ